MFYNGDDVVVADPQDDFCDETGTVVETLGGERYRVDLDNGTTQVFEDWQLEDI